jgi:hypothetical protein
MALTILTERDDRDIRLPDLVADHLRAQSLVDPMLVC